jgi:hypothetical protein
MDSVGACVFGFIVVYLKIFKRLKGFQGIMASSGDGAGHFSSTSLVRRGMASTQAGDGPAGKGSGTQHALNVQLNHKQ